MLKSILVGILSAGLFFNPPVPKITAEVDRTEDGDFAVTLVYVDRGYREDYYQFDIPQEDYNERKADGEDLEVDVAVGTFSGDIFEMTDINMKKDMYYQFKSYDNEVWWCLTEKDMGFIPKEGKEYVLAFYQNGTTKDNHECPEEYDCDCYCYDDIFLGVYDR